MPISNLILSHNFPRLLSTTTQHTYNEYKVCHINLYLELCMLSFLQSQIIIVVANITETFFTIVDRILLFKTHNIIIIFFFSKFLIFVYHLISAFSLIIDLNFFSGIIIFNILLVNINTGVAKDFIFYNSFI